MVCGEKEKFLYLFFILGIFLSLSFVFGAHTITTSGGGSSYSVDEDVGFIYNISVQNTDTSPAANISQVNITIPATFSFLSGSNITDAGTHTFTNTSTVLSWENDGLVMNSTTNYFSFNATASTPGSYNLTVYTLNATGVYSSNISVTVNDTTAPRVSFSELVSGGNYSGSVVINVTITDDSAIDTVFFNVTNISGVQVATYTASNVSATAWNATFDSTGFTEGVYNITAYVNDTAGNSNNSVLVSGVTLDNTAPSVSFSCTPSSLNIGGVVTCYCSGSDALSGVASTSYSVNPSTSSIGTRTTTCIVTDYSGNSASASDTYIVISGGGLVEEEWVNTYVYDDAELSEKGSLQIMFSEKERARLKIEGNTHYVGVVEISGVSVILQVSSDVQEATLAVGDVSKFDVDSDGYYEVSVTLGSLSGDEANLIISAIDEEVPTGGTGGGDGSSGKNLLWLWIVLGVLVAVIIVIVYRKNKKKKKK